MLRDLRSEWTRLATAPSSIRRVNSWGLSESPIQHLDDVLLLAGFGRDPKDSVADRYLFLLVRRASTDELAARIVLQRLLPPLVSIARRRGKVTVGGFDEALTDVISHAWMLIRTYPVERRPAKVASNLVRDSEYHAFVRPTRYQRYTVQLCDPSTMTHLVAPESDESAQAILVELVDQVSPSMSAHSVMVLQELADGLTIEQIAIKHGVQLRTARTWRREAISELRAQRRSAA
jgi:DNA-directed RNA polymerase specialized sigma24 family protein